MTPPAAPAPAGGVAGLRRAWGRLSSLNKAVVCILLVGFFFTCMDTTSKALSQRYDPLFVVWARYASQAAAALLVFAPSLTSRLRTRHLRLQLLRSALLFFATIMFFSGFALMPLAEVIAVAQVAPLAITALAALALAERVGPYRWAGVAAGFLGALVIIGPSGAEIGWAALLPLGGALSFAAYSVATRFLGAEESPWTTFLYTGAVGAAAATLALPWVWETPDIADLPLLAAVGLFGGAGQLMLIFAMGFAPASAVAPFLYINLLWAALFGFVFFDEIPGVATMLGGALIVGAGLYVRHRERLAQRRRQATASLVPTGPER